MLRNVKKRSGSKQDGFTIIEVLIVLAIAGLILLIVFLAVPALQRSARNTQRKNDASAVAGAVANYLSNNGGSLPTNVSDNGTSQLLVGTAAGQNSESAKLGYYVTGSTGAYAATDGKIYIESNAGPFTTAAAGLETTTAVSNQSLIIDTGYTCDSSNTNVGSASPRTAAILFVTESGSGNGSLQCVEQ